MTTKDIKILMTTVPNNKISWYLYFFVKLVKPETLSDRMPGLNI